jgi:hypothetical protein
VGDSLHVFPVLAGDPSGRYLESEAATALSLARLNDDSLGNSSSNHGLDLEMDL